MAATAAPAEAAKAAAAISAKAAEQTNKTIKSEREREREKVAGKWQQSREQAENVQGFKNRFRIAIDIHGERDRGGRGRGAGLIVDTFEPLRFTLCHLPRRRRGAKNLAYLRGPTC